MKVFLWIVFAWVGLFVLSIASIWIYVAYFGQNSEPNWHVEKNAVPSQNHPLAGFYKEGDCKDPWGWAVGPAGENKYYISFCGPGGCFAEGTYRSNTSIIGDPNYKVVDENSIDFKSNDGWSAHIRCPSRT